MVDIVRLADAALSRDALHLRELTQSLLREHSNLSAIVAPITDTRRLITAAALIELFASRRNQIPPRWAREAGALTEPFYLVAATEHMRRLKELCEKESPEALSRHGFYAPPDFLDFA
ncbi:MAG: hypothetical protein WEB58_07675 [Planctomycetaceae bacterium]